MISHRYLLLKSGTLSSNTKTSQTLKLMYDPLFIMKRSIWPALNIDRSAHYPWITMENFSKGASLQQVQPPQEPGDEIEQEETLTHYTITVVNDIQPLPPRQKDAFMQSLKDQIGDILPIVDALIDHGIDVNAVEKAQGKKEQQQLRASLSVARKKFKMENYNFPF